ncbi:sigma-70 family RNA polymerase sigma factor [Dactylosporangium sp. CA-233914]|uniref:sigma-70 family RNA polymerase sigma factor n=1 Tax=Dactylosporangium sp. CA-233914 TaxID=3239934 RepID=UPI003D8F92AF
MTQGEAGPVRDVTSLVRAAQGGDDRALDELIAGHLPLVYNVIGRALNRHADVDDLVQETMIQVVRGLPGLREPARFRSWVVAIAYRQIQMHRRGATRRQPPAREVPEELPDPGGDFEERSLTGLMLTGQRRELAEATGWLEDADRHLLALWWQEVAGDLTRVELAAALGLKATHAAVRVQRMRAQLDAARGLVRALHATPRCPGLAEVLKPWDGGRDALWRKRLTRHVRGCRRCCELGRDLLAPEKLLPGIAALPLPVFALAGLKTAAFSTGGAHAATGALGKTGVLANLQHLVQSKAAAVAAVAVVAGGGIAVAVYETPPAGEDGTPRAAAPPATGGAVAPDPPAPADSGGPSIQPGPSSTAGIGPASGVGRAEYFVAPNGSDSADGSLEHPFATLTKAATVVRPGQTIALRGGTYRPTAPITVDTSGTEDQRITLSSYGTEHPIIDASRIPADKWAITQHGSYWTVQGLEVMNSRSHAYVCISCRQNRFLRLSMHDNVESGLTLRGENTIGNQVLDSDFFNNHNPADQGQSGIGMAIKFGSGEDNTVRGCRAFNNADDGFDFGDFAGAIDIQHNWAFGNGVSRWGVSGWRSNGNGFTFGGGNPPASASHSVRHNAAWDNIHNGFADGGNPAELRLSNNTAFRNGATGFGLPGSPATLRSNVSIGNDASVSMGAGAHTSRNTWDEGTWTASMFRSTDASAAQGARRADGTLPATDFLSTGNGMGASMSEA